MGSEDARPHLLLLAAHFGPSGHTGGFRWHGLLEGLAERGWTADVVTSTPAERARPPDGVTVHTTGDEWAGSRLRGWLADRRAAAAGAAEDGADEDGADEPADAQAVPPPGTPWPGRRRPLGDVALADQLRRDVVDASRLLTEAVWARRVAANALALPRTPDVVVSTSPAELLLPVGRLVARRLGVAHVPDFRDLWVVGRPDWAMRSRPLTALGRLLEPRVLADAPVTVDIASTAAEARAQQSTTPAAFIPSGWAPLPTPPAQPDPLCFRVVYSGWLYPDMDLRGFFAGCAVLLRDRPDARALLRVSFLGSPTHVAGVALADLAATSGLDPDHVEVTGRLPREQATAREAAAAVLLCPGFTDGLHTPSKLYGYARLRGALLVVGRQDDALAREAAQLGIRSVRSAEEVGERLVAAYDRWAAGGPWPITDADALLASEHSAVAWDGLLRDLLAGVDGATAAATHGSPLPPADEVLDATTGRGSTSGEQDGRRDGRAGGDGTLPPPGDRPVRLPEPSGAGDRRGA